MGKEGIMMHLIILILTLSSLVTFFNEATRPPLYPIEITCINHFSLKIFPLRLFTSFR